MKLKSVEILVMPNLEKISKEEQELFIRKISIAANEINFVKNWNLKIFVFPDKCAEHMLIALKKLDPSLKLKDSLYSVLKFAEYCTSDESQDLVYSLLLNYLEKPKNELIFFNINPTIKETSRIDSFLEICYNLMNSRKNNQILPITLIGIIIEGPYSLKSTSLLKKLFVESEEMLKSVINTKINVEKLAIKLVKSGDIESFLSIFSTKDESESIVTLKTVLELKTINLEIILNIINPEHNVLQLDASEIMKYAAELKCDYKISQSYWKFDPDFVKNFTLELNSKVIRIIDKFRSLKSLDEKIIHLFSAYVYINLIPGIESSFMPLAQYEPILDFTIEMIKSNVKFDLTFHLIRNVICLPFVEVTESGLEKLWYIYNHKFAGNLHYLNVSMASIVMSKFKDQNNAFETFKMIFNFYESKKIDFNVVASLLIIQFSKPTFLDVFKFCKHRKLLHKVQINSIEKSFGI